MRKPDVMCEAQLTQAIAGVKPAQSNSSCISVSPLKSLVSHRLLAHELTEKLHFWLVLVFLNVM